MPTNWPSSARSSRRRCGNKKTALPRTGEGAVSLRHPFRPAPTLKRRPDATLEPEAVDWRRRVDGADAIESDAGPLEAAFLQHPARRRVGDACACLQRLVAQVGEGIVDHRMQRLGGVAFAPMIDAQPVAELRRLLLQDDAASADD